MKYAILSIVFILIFAVIVVASFFAPSLQYEGSTAAEEPYIEVFLPEQSDYTNNDDALPTEHSNGEENHEYPNNGDYHEYPLPQNDRNPGSLM